MKKIFTCICIVILISAAFLSQQTIAQTPQKISFQAIIRDDKGQLVTNHDVGLRISILQGSTTGTTVYTESQTPITNANGLINIEIGGETGFEIINWANGIYFIKTETDPEGGTNYSIIGISQLLSVPYALHSKTADSLTGTIAEIDPVFGTSAAIGITDTNIANWTTAYDWGNHAVAGYLTSYTETDPYFKASVAKSILETDTTKWNNKLDHETQNLADVIAVNNSANAQIKNVTNPTDAQDAATKAYVDILKAQIQELQAAMGGTDIDGNHYNAIKIGNQVWMKENLKTTKFSNGESISTTTPVQMDITGESNPNYQWAYNGDNNNVIAYGRLYTYYAVSDSRNVCPTGWHVPTDADWTILTTYAGGENTGGSKLKEAGFNHWSPPNPGVTNETGFTALPGGSRSSDGSFGDIGLNGRWWSSTPAYFRYMYWGNSTVYRGSGNDKVGFSVRCIKD